MPLVIMLSYAECIFMLGVVMLGVFLLRIIMLFVILLIVILLIVTKLARLVMNFFNKTY